MPVRDLSSLPVRYWCSSIPASQRSWVQIPYRPYFFWPYFHYCEDRFHIYVFIRSSQNDFQTFTVKALALLFVRWMVGGRVNLKITIIPVDNDSNNNNNNNNNNDNNDNNITLDHNIYNDELMIVMNFLFLLLTLCSSRGSTPCHRKLVMQNSCPQLRSHTNV